MIRLAHITTIPLSLLVLVDGQTAYMKKNGLDVCGISSPGDLADQFSRQYQVPFYPVKMTRRISPLSDVIAFIRLCAILMRLRPQIVHTHTPKAGLLGTLASWLTGVPVRVYQMHGLRYATTSGLKRKVLMLSEKAACASASVVICEGRSVYSQAAEDGICRREKMMVIGRGSANGVDTVHQFNPDLIAEDTISSLKQKYNIPPQAVVLGFVGRLVRDKGLIEFFNAWKALRDDFPDLHAFLIGPFEDQDPLPEDVRAALLNDPRIHLTGYVDREEMPSLLAAIDILALPSYREGFPISLLEASAMKVPIVTTKVTGCVDAVVDGVTGTLVNPHDSAALAEAVRSYLVSSERRKAHGEAGRQYIVKEFKPENIWKEIYNVYISGLA